MLIFGCGQLSGLLRPPMNEVERYYYQGKKAQAAQEWEQAFAYYKRAYMLAKDRRGTIYFDDPKKNNYPTTFKILFQAMDAVGANILKPGDWRSPMRQQMEKRQAEMLERMLFSQNLFTRAEELSREKKYLQAMEVMDQIITAYPYSSEAEKARQLKREYNRELKKYRKQLLEEAIAYYNQRNYEMARQTFDLLFATHPDTPEAAEAKAKIEYYLQQIEQATNQKKSK
jgi:tetratricopeptide (TPR) repeat protein